MARAEICAVGDVFLDRETPENTFSHVNQTLSDADFLIGNYEASFSNAGEQAKFRPWSNFLFSPPEMVRGVIKGGFDVVSLANNQSMNYGPEGLLDTIDLLSEHDIGVTGAGATAESAEAPYTLSGNGLDIGVLAFESTWWDWPATKAKPNRPGLNQIGSSPYFGPPYLNELDLERMESQISDAAETHDALLTMFHFGIAGEFQHTLAQEALAHRAIDSGADAVLGAHSHTLQGVEVYESAPIFYSLGNFAFDRPETWALDLMPSESALATITVSENGVVEANLSPAVYDYGSERRPRLLSPDDDKFGAITDHLIWLSDRTGTSLKMTPTGLEVPLDQ